MHECQYVLNMLECIQGMLKYHLLLFKDFGFCEYGVTRWMRLLVHSAWTRFGASPSTKICWCNMIITPKLEACSILDMPHVLLFPNVSRH